MRITSTAFAVYTLVGFGLVAAGPMKKAIAEAVDEAGRSNDGSDRLFKWVLSTACIVAWPLMLFAVLQDRRQKENRRRTLATTVREGIQYVGMGGGGTVTCEACNFSQHIISFTHGGTDKGERCCNTGYQCLSCGRLTDVFSTQSEIQQDELRCVCGGTLSREHVLFCPNCRSKALRYDMEYIT
jgi:hypothetical protein